jgi:hypothetical protein
MWVGAYQWDTSVKDFSAAPDDNLRLLALQTPHCVVVHVVPRAIDRADSPAASYGTSSPIRSSPNMRPDASKLGLPAGHSHDVVDGLAGELCLPLGHEQPGQVVGSISSPAIGCSAERLPLKRATHNLDRLTSSWLRRIWIASLTRRPCR